MVKSRKCGLRAAYLTGRTSSADFWTRSSLSAGGQEMGGSCSIGGQIRNRFRNKSVTDGMLRDGK